MREALSLHPTIASHPFAYKFIVDPDGLVDFYNTAVHSWSPYIVDNKLHRLEFFLKSLASKHHGKTTYVDWELNKHLPDYEEAVRENGPPLCISGDRAAMAVVSYGPCVDTSIAVRCLSFPIAQAPPPDRSGCRVRRSAGRSLLQE